MSNAVRAVALNTMLNEVKNACPDVQTTFIFEQNGKILAKNDDANMETASGAAENFTVLTERADAIGGLETVTFYGTQRRMTISEINDLYLATVASKESDEKYTTTLTRVLVPTVLKLVDNMPSQCTQDTELQTDEPEIRAQDEASDYEEEEVSDTEETRPDQIDESADSAEPELEEEEQPDSRDETEPYVPEPPATQFMVEHLGGLLVPPDTVRIDNVVILQWKELYEDKELTQVDVETLNGQTVRCKFKPIKDSKQEGKGIIQMPQKIQLTLQTSKGELVMVKPVIN